MSVREWKTDSISPGGTTKGEDFKALVNIPVDVQGDDRPAPVFSFKKLELHKKIKQNLGQRKYTQPTAIQQYAIPAILDCRDLLACAQTGSGKTASFLLPIISNFTKDIDDRKLSPNFQRGAPCSPLALVLAPTRELAMQIHGEATLFAKGTKIKSTVVYSGPRKLRKRHRNKVQRGCHILIGTPGMLCYLNDQGELDFSYLEFLVIDEGDKMLTQGLGDQLEEIITDSTMPAKEERITLMFSATFEKDIQKLAHEHLRSNFLFIAAGRIGSACPDITQVVLKVLGSEKREKLDEILEQNRGNERTLIFAERRCDVQKLEDELKAKGHPVTSLYGNKDQRARTRAINDFKDGTAPLLVATAVASRGLDIKDVNHVIYYDLPKDYNVYVNGIGRTGRIGNKGFATLFYDPQQDVGITRALLKILAEAGQEVPEWLETLADRAVGTKSTVSRKSFGDQRRRRPKKPAQSSKDVIDVVKKIEKLSISK